MDTNQRIKLLQIALQYTLPKLQATLIKEEDEDQPLFVEDIPINWKDASGERETITTYIKKN